MLIEKRLAFYEINVIMKLLYVLQYLIEYATYIESLFFKEVSLMAYNIGDSCISCGACESECPVACITAGSTKFVINEDACIDCGACANVCPVDAPKQD